MPITRLNPKQYSDAIIVDGVFHRNHIHNWYDDRRHCQRMGDALYALCREYFERNFHAVFFVDAVSAMDIFQNSLVTLLEKIDNRKIYVEDGVLKGENGKPFTSTLTTYFMSIAILKYKEWVRDWSGTAKIFDDLGREEVYEILYDDKKDALPEIVSDCISKMSEQCNQILTLFYYEEKKLEEIMKEIDTYKSHNALKTKKYKCMVQLRESANAIYHRLFH